MYHFRLLLKKLLPRKGRFSLAGYTFRPLLTKLFPGKDSLFRFVQKIIQTQNMQNQSQPIQDIKTQCQQDTPLPNSNKGQVTVEYILLAVALLVLVQATTNTLKNTQALKSLQETPQNIFTNMVENGNWELDTTKSRFMHPNHHESHYTPNGKGP